MVVLAGTCGAMATPCCSQGCGAAMQQQQQQLRRRSATAVGRSCRLGGDLYRFVVRLVVLAVLGSRLGVEAQKCSADEFTCQLGACIPRWQHCNGHGNCGLRDNSDELHCPKVDDCGQTGGFECVRFGALRCLPVVYQCDGYSDCDDEIDETLCRTLRPTSLLSSVNTAAQHPTVCEWSTWSECSLPTCNTQERRPIPVGTGNLNGGTGEITNCSHSHEFRPCSLGECSRIVSGEESLSIVIAACAIAFGLLCIGAFLEIVLRRQYKRRSLMVKSASNQSAQTNGTTVQTDGHDAASPLAIPMVTITTQQQQPQVVALPPLNNHLADSSNAMSGSLATAETFLDVSADSAQIVALQQAEIRRSLQQAAADIERLADTDRSATTSPSQSEAGATRQLNATPDRFALLSPSQFNGSPCKLRAQTRRASAAAMTTTTATAAPPSTFCESSLATTCGGSCHGEMYVVENGVRDMTQQQQQQHQYTTPSPVLEPVHMPVLQVAAEGGEFCPMSARMFHQIQPHCQYLVDDDDDAMSTEDGAAIEERLPKLHAVEAPINGYAAALHSRLAWLPAPAPSCNSSINELSGQDLLLLAAALHTNASIGGSSLHEDLPPRKQLIGSSADERSTCSSSRHSRSQMAIPCNTPVSANYDVHSSSLEDSTSCGRFFHPAQLTVSGAA